VYWVHFVYTTALAAVGIVLLVTRLMRVSSLYRRQSLTLVVAVMLPLLGNTASSLGLGPARTYDPTPIAVSLSGLVLVWGAFRYRLLDLLPVARTLAFDRLGDPVLVVDVYGRVVDRNPAAARALGEGAAIGAPVQDLLQEQVALMDATAAGAEIRLEHGGETREFEIVASPLGDGHGRHAGQLLLLRDITARKRAERQLRWLADYDQLTGLPEPAPAGRPARPGDRPRPPGARALRAAAGRPGQVQADQRQPRPPAWGTRCSRWAGSRLRAGRREEDTAARMGGDEFALVLPEAVDTRRTRRWWRGGCSPRSPSRCCSATAS
jgi:PAS domain S-box-containing protein